VNKCQNRKWGERCHCERCERRRASRRRNSARSGGQARRPASMLMATSFATVGSSGASPTRSGSPVAPLVVNGDFYASASAASSKASGSTMAPIGATPSGASNSEVTR